jgi:peroxiredoxin
MTSRRTARQPREPRARLIAINSREDEPKEFNLLKPIVSIGSYEDNDFAIRKAIVSQHHATLRSHSDYFELTDLSSTNGTFVNGWRIRGTIAVSIGDELSFGGARFVLANAPFDGKTFAPLSPKLGREKISLRAALEVGLLTLAIGFGGAQYLAYLFYHEENKLLLAAAVPLPAAQTRRAIGMSHLPQSNQEGRPAESPSTAQAAAVNGPPRHSVSTSNSVPASHGIAPTSFVPSREPDELAAAVSLARLFPGSGTRAGEFASDFQLPDLAGSRVSLSSMRGKTILLIFWATWCGACRAELPKLQAMYAGLRPDADFQLLTVNIDQRTGAALAFVQSNHYQFPVLLDADGVATNAYDVRGIPANFIIDRRGKILWDCAGGIDWSNQLLQQELKKLF